MFVFFTKDPASAESIAVLIASIAAAVNKPDAVVFGDEEAAPLDGFLSGQTLDFIGDYIDHTPFYKIQFLFCNCAI
jgi:hypothetical protein